MNTQQAPVIVFAYNRPEHLRKVLESLERNAEAASSVLYVYCDGPKAGASEETKKNIEEVRKVASEKKWCGTVHVIAAETNRGLADSVTGGVEDVLAIYGKTIVLEDDAVCSKYFLEYMNTALDLYENKEEVISVAGFLYPVKATLPDTFFLRGADCIAWATWQRGWKYFRYDASLLLSDIEQCGTKQHFEFNHSYPYVQMLLDQVEGKIDSWAIRWYASAYLAGKFTLYPGKSMVRNIGFDGSGINSGTSEKWDTGAVDFHPVVKPIPVVENEGARETFEQFFREIRNTPLTSRVKEVIWSRLPGFIRRAWTGTSGTKLSGWHGNYKTWGEALEHSEGYDSKVILDKVAASLHKVKNGEAAYERDSVTFDKLEVQDEVAAWLKKISAESKSAIRVADYGGSLGSTYFQYKNVLGKNAIAQWTIIEQEHFAAKGVSEFENDVLKFSPSPEIAGEADVLLLFSVLPYLEYPYEAIADLVQRGYAYIIIDRTPVIAGEEDRLTVQIVPEHIYKASYPAWFFSEGKLLNAFDGYKLVESFTSKFAGKYKFSDGGTAEWKGYVFKRL